MALQQDILLAVSTDNEGSLRLANLDETFASYDCSIRDVSIDLTDGAPQWYQYFLCGVKGICELMSIEARLKGLCVMVSGTIPKSAGLSSSSALVCAAALATAFAHEIELSKEEIADVCAKCERYIGTQGGGMDQAIAFLATKGCAKLIKFDPLRSEDVRLPSGAVFVIAHSLAELNKAATADYNCRVVECRLAAQIIAKENGLEWKNIKKLGQLQSILKVDLETMCNFVKKHLHGDIYQKDEIMKLLETTPTELESTSLTANTTRMDTFKLYQRAMHVYEEALRVERFHAECANSVGGGASGETTLEALGNLMLASHASLRDLYECSHPQLDRLVELSSGLAYGARLTGAGWGGCVVALLAKENVDKYMTMLKQKYYKSCHQIIKNGDDSEYNSILFATEPQSGASVYID